VRVVTGAISTADLGHAHVNNGQRRTDKRIRAWVVQSAPVAILIRRRCMSSTKPYQQISLQNFKESTYMATACSNNTDGPRIPRALELPWRPWDSPRQRIHSLEVYAQRVSRNTGGALAHGQFPRQWPASLRAGWFSTAGQRSLPKYKGRVVLMRRGAAPARRDLGAPALQ
jgi:hypothetical protein